MSGHFSRNYCNCKYFPLNIEMVHFRIPFRSRTKSESGRRTLHFGFTTLDFYYLMNLAVGTSFLPAPPPSFLSFHPHNIYKPPSILLLLPPSKYQNYNIQWVHAWKSKTAFDSCCCAPKLYDNDSLLEMYNTMESPSIQLLRNFSDHF